MLNCITGEQAPIEMIVNLMNSDREDEDLIEYSKTSISNKLFSFVLNKNLKCPRGHKKSEISVSLGLQLKSPKRK